MLSAARRDAVRSPPGRGGPAIVAVAVAFAACALPACGGPVTEGGVCGPGRACVKGTACVVGRCRASEVVPTPSDASRLVLEPVDLAVLSASSDAGDGWSAPILLGREAQGEVVLLLRWEARVRQGTEIASAFVVLEPVRAAPPPAGPVRVDVARVLSPWTSRDASWARKPRIEAPELGAVAVARGGAPVRIEVTEIVRRWTRRLPDDHGIALFASGDDPVGLVCAPLSSGRGPRLEVYFR